MKIQRMLENTAWVDVEEGRIDEFLDYILTREPMISRAEVLAKLATGQELYYASYWYAKLRDADAIASRPARTTELVRCSCGHSVDRRLVMSTSCGTSCPECYDRLSD